MSDERRGKRAVQGREILRGDLSGFSLISLLQIAEIERISGWIHLSEGSIILVDGMVIGASCGRFAGLDALRELLFGATGRFSVVRGEVSGSEPIADVTAEVMESCRRRDEWSRWSAKVLRRRSPGEAESVDGPLGALLGALNGVLPLAEAARRAKVTPTQVIDGVVAALARGGLVEVRHVQPPAVVDDDEAPPLSASVPTPTPTGERAVDDAVERAGGADDEALAAAIEGADFDELMSRARDARRAGALELAEALIRRALVLAPEDRVALQNLRRIQELRGERRGSDGT